MSPEQFNATRAEAVALHARQVGEPRVSLDAIFLALCARPQRARKASASTAPDAPAEWFTRTLAAHAGEQLTIADFLFRAGRFPVTRRDAIDAGRWLRAAGKVARKTGGRQLFAL